MKHEGRRKAYLDILKGVQINIIMHSSVTSSPSLDGDLYCSVVTEIRHTYIMILCHVMLYMVNFREFSLKHRSRSTCDPNRFVGGFQGCAAGSIRMDKSVLEARETMNGRARRVEHVFLLFYPRFHHFPTYGIWRRVLIACVALPSTS